MPYEIDDPGNPPPDFLVNTQVTMEKSQQHEELQEPQQPHEPRKSQETQKSPETQRPEQQQQQQQQQQQEPPSPPSLARAQELLQTKNDTARFAGLAVLKAYLDNSAELRANESVLAALWESVPAKFLDRLVRTGTSSSSSSSSSSSTTSAAGDGGDEAGSRAKKARGKDMLDLAVAVLHTFASLLPDSEKQKPKFGDRIPVLVAALLTSSPASTKLILQTLASLVSLPEGASAFVRLEDVSPLIELAPQHPKALDVLCFAWLGAAVPEAATATRTSLATMIDDGLLRLALAFKGTDAVTLLAFIGQLFRDLDPQLLPTVPRWLNHLTTFIHNLVAQRPAADARYAYTTAAAALLLAYPSQAGPLMFTFTHSTRSEKPASYLLMSLILVDIRSTVPTLLESLNSPAYGPVSYRISCGFDVISSFTGFVIRCMDDDADAPLPMPPDLLLKLRKSVGETMSVTIEYLRDRWDAAHAGAMGLHPEARSSATHAPSGAMRLPLAWDSVAGAVMEEDALILAALRALALWVREDDGDMLRREAAGLCDLLVELYQSSVRPPGASKSARELDFRPPVLIALEAVTTTEEGIETALKHDAWAVLAKDLVAILDLTSKCNDEAEALRGTEIVRVLLSMVEDASSGTAEEWMGLVTKVAAWDCPEAAAQGSFPEAVAEFHIAALQLVCALVVGSHAGMRRRYEHSISAARGIAEIVGSRLASGSPLAEGIEDVISTLGGI